MSGKSKIIMREFSFGWRDLLLYAAVAVVAALLLFLGNRIAGKDVAFYNGTEIGPRMEKGKVVEITDEEIYERENSSGNLVRDIDVYFRVRLSSGENKGDTVDAMQSLRYTVGAVNRMTKETEVGDRVLIRYVGEDAEPQWQFVQLIRTNKLLILAIILFVILIIFGRIKGIQIMISIGFTCCAVFLFFVPSILSGISIYFSAVLVCIYSIIMTFLIVNGFHRKTFCAMIGALCGIAASGLLSLLMNRFMSMSGYLDESSLELTYLAMEKPIDLRAVLFAAVLIGALGVIMDVSMSIASSMWELRESSNESDFRTLFRSGLNIGRDITGTMANTLILAYIGGSLTEVLLLVTANTSLPYLLNREVVIAEILQTLIGVFSILFTIPLTALICAALYTKGSAKRS
ncbi:MAG: YibE/F family protein [Oscillospiraceae bacterium]|jgi:uncharacterized membrane protein|nr:YibE/F family protein [Oscillospiraceae bacterium]